ncbi:hypothetical protein [Chamaesiphon sp. OTE_75_metabat_556]|jgi:hypothetical protein|uniref:hypothetical protein n=1 Tax=Chamaesiphon sp. OTE_75_metabat_556 TaxID=2964692 RepID=UPI00286ADA7B|nr:hypothetical protein [Chamaesiphon sp. OTE_75_metabat_556]
MEYIPGIIAYFIGGYMCCVSRVFIWTIASHWSKIWVADASQADSQVLSLTFIITLLLVSGFAVLVWSIANHINYKFTEKGFLANGAAGIAIAIAVGQNSWLGEIAAKMTYAN